jgi:hypothetical protein
VAGRWFYPSNPVSSTNKTDRHEITEILLKVALNTIIQTLETRQYTPTNMAASSDMGKKPEIFQINTCGLF